MAATKHEYIPGVCNIGREEIRVRMIMAWGALAVGVAMAVGFVVYRVSPVWRLTLFGPAMFAAMGFLQSWWGFCAAFGFSGVFNLGPEVGKTDTVEQDEARREDRLTALKIFLLATAAATSIAALAYYLPL